MSEKSGKSAEGKDSIERLLERGTEMLGSGANAVTSGALALLIGGPEGLAIGGVLGKGVEIALNKVGQEISTRQLAPREETRVGDAFAYAAAEINRRLENGDALRDDGFFDQNRAGRSDAEEAAESILLKIQREPEEKKIQYMGYLLSSIAFNPEISVQMAHQLTKIAEQLTYRQLCILKLSVVKEKYELRNMDYREHGDLSRDLYQVLYECAELYDKQFINFKGESNLHAGEYKDFGATIDGLTSAKPRRMTLQGLGEDLFNLMNLYSIPDEDIAPIAVQLKQIPT